MIDHIGNRLDFIYSNLRISDLIDVGLFACFVYYFLKYFIAKPQRPIMTFSVFVSILYVLSKVFNLILISALLKLLFTVILIVIAIIFQRDIRRFIEQLSSKFSGMKSKRKLPPNDKDKICEIVTNLAEKKIGAILVFVGNAPVSNIITAGKPLYAKLDSDLVESIFDSRTPAHDGAMIIENGYITHICCQLPLSKGNKLRINLGTRHSAALGLSERSDSLTFVISEEKGTISIAENNRLIYDVKKRFIEARLHQYSKRKNKSYQKKNKLSDYLRKNFSLKLSSLFIAISAWVVNIYEPGISYTSFMMPVEVRNLKSEFMINKMSDDIVKVTLSGPSNYVSQLKKTPQKVILDFQQAKNGMTVFQSSDFQVSFPKNVNIHSYHPDKISAFLSQYANREVPIVLKTKGELNERYKLSDIVISPQGKKVHIPINLNDQKINLPTRSIDLSQINKKNYKIKTKVSLPEKVRLQNDESFYVEVKFRLEEKTL